MHVYRTFNSLDEASVGHPEYFGVMKEAHDDARAFNAPVYPMVRIELVDVKIDKSGLVELLNEVQKFEILRTWCLTARGGLKEIENGE